MPPPPSEREEESPAAAISEIRADIKNLTGKIDEMHAENREWRAQQLTVLTQLSENKKEMEAVLRRLGSLEKDVRSLLAFRWYVVGVAAVVAIALAKIF